MAFAKTKNHSYLCSVRVNWCALHSETITRIKNMDKDEITILREQLSEKDKQIAELQRIIYNFTENEKENTECHKESDQGPGFWERHITLSYIALCVVIILGLIFLVSPFITPSFWERMGTYKQLNYTFATIAFVGLGLIAWTNTPRGRKWLKEL